MFLTCMAGFVQDSMGRFRGQALVPEVNRQASQRAQFGGKGLRLGGLRAQLAGEMERIADHDSSHAKPPRQARQRAQILAPVAAALQRQHRLRGQPQFVGDGYADAAIADIEAKIARLDGGFQRLCSRLSA